MTQDVFAEAGWFQLLSPSPLSTPVHHLSLLKWLKHCSQELCPSWIETTLASPLLAPEQREWEHMCAINPQEKDFQNFGSQAKQAAKSVYSSHALNNPDSVGIPQWKFFEAEVQRASLLWGVKSTEMGGTMFAAEAEPGGLVEEHQIIVGTTGQWLRVTSQM